MNPSNFVTIGKVLGAHGVNGAVKVRYYGESPDLLTQRRLLILRMPMGGDAERGVEWARPHAKGMLLKLEGTDSRDSADALREALLQIERSELPAIEEDDTYYWADLVGMEVVDRDEALIGTLDAILETGSNDVYVVRGPAGEVLVPALAEVVLEVDVAGKRMRVDLPEGL